MNINAQNKRDWHQFNIYLVNCVIIIYNLTKLCMAKTAFYATNIWYLVAIFKTIDMFFSEIYLAFSVPDKVKSYIYYLDFFRAKQYFM